MTTALASSARRAIRSRNTKFFVSVAWGKDGPLVGIAGSLFFGRGRGTKTPDARRAQHAQKRQFVRFVRFGGAIAAARVIPRLLDAPRRQLSTPDDDGHARLVEDVYLQPWLTWARRHPPAACWLQSLPTDAACWRASRRGDASWEPRIQPRS